MERIAYLGEGTVFNLPFEWPVSGDMTTKAVGIKTNVNIWELVRA